MRISSQVVEELISHAREEAPNECCGMIAGRDGEATGAHRVRNEWASPLRFRMEAGEQYKTWKSIEESPDELVAIYHSHTGSEAYPSQTDINESLQWPNQMQVIVSVRDPEEPVVRGFWIRDGKVEEADLDVD
jgi:proteasome lid subunit RPN8/RPN11